MDLKTVKDDTTIKVMYLNPVGNSAYDQVFADMAKEFKYSFSAVDIVSLNPETVPPKMDNLEYRAYESLIVRDTVQAARYAAKHSYDAMVIGCFYDPALLEAREISGDTIVVAPCQASLNVALDLANNFSIIIGMWKWEDQMRQTVYEYGYKDKLVSFKAVGLRVDEFHADPAKTKKLLMDAARDAVNNDRAESIVLGCTLEIGFYKELQQAVGVPVIDAAIASFKAAENAAVLKKNVGWTNSRKWGMQPPPEKELADFQIFQKDYKFGNVIHVPSSP